MDVSPLSSELFLKMRCSPLIKKIFRFLHLLTIIVFIIGAILEIKSIQDGKEWSVMLPSILLIMILITIPNQICVGLNDKDGFISVIGSVISIISYIVIIILTIKKRNENKTKKHKS